jgi:peptide/nickel transport system ATP-binding protein
MLLREAAPDPESDFGRDTRFEAQGDPPDLTSLPSGCPFVPRCPFARSECEIALPDWRQVGPQHRVRCVLYGAAGSSAGAPGVDDPSTSGGPDA